MNYPHIVDVGAVTSLGLDWPSTWQALLAGRARITTTADMHLFEPTVFPVSAVENLDREIRGSANGPCAGLFDRLLSQAPATPDARIYASTNHGESDLLRSFLRGLTSEQADALLGEPLALTARGRASFTYAACAGGLHAAVHAAFDCADGITEKAIVVSADALSLIETVGFARAGALGKQGARPFAADRDGLLIGEGGAGLVFGVGPYSDDGIHILGIGMSCDAFHPTDPDPSGESLARAVTMCLEDAGLQPEHVEAVVAHGTGTKKGDAIELAVLQRVWGRAPLRVTSVKGQVGHLMGAAGLLNLLVACEASRSGKLPPTVSRTGEQPDPAVVTGRYASITPGAAVLCLASGFGGNNVAVLVGRRQHG